MTIGVVPADGATGQVLAQFADHYTAPDVWGINNTVTNRGQARQAINNWARKLREQLVRKRGAI